MRFMTSPVNCLLRSNVTLSPTLIQSNLARYHGNGSKEKWSKDFVQSRKEAKTRFGATRTFGSRFEEAGADETAFLNMLNMISELVNS